MKSHLFYLIILVLSTAIFSCRKIVDPPLENDSKFDVIIGNEGAFGAGNASFSLYSSSKDSTWRNPVYDQNGTSLGDVAQSPYLINGNIWCPINNSNKVVILDTVNFKIKDQIENLESPRSGALAGSYFYLSSLYSRNLYQINTTSLDVESFVMPYSEAEKIVYDSVENVLWIAFHDTACHYLYTFDLAQKVIKDSIYLNDKRAPLDIIIMPNTGRNVILLTGYSWKGETYALHRYERNSGVLATADLAASDYSGLSVGSPGLSTYGMDFYLLATDFNATSAPNGIYRVAEADLSLPSSPFILPPDGVSYFYAFGVSPNGVFYATDPRSFTTDGQVYRYDKQATLLGSFTAGIIPNSFLFL